MAKDDVVFAITSKALVFICWLFKSLHGDMKKKKSLYLSFVIPEQKKVAVSINLFLKSLIF